MNQFKNGLKKKEITYGPVGKKEKKLGYNLKGQRAHKTNKETIDYKARFDLAHVNLRKVEGPRRSPEKAT